MEMLLINCDSSLETIAISKTDSILKLLQQGVGGYVDVITCSGYHAKEVAPAFYVNDEGRLNGMRPNFPATWLLHILSEAHHDETPLLYGPAVLAGTVRKDGSAIGLSETMISTIYQLWGLGNDD